jgi:MerR family transcriptional regulator, light-induced transcriptional regulator
LSGAGRYRIHAVAELTGVPEATLRAWERRYAVPVPVRTPSGYRLYSPKDVEQVKRMRELCSSGVAPVDAAKMVAQPQGQPAPRPASELDEDPFEVMGRRIVEATRRMDPALLEAEVRLAMTIGDAAAVVERAYCPALAEIGREWERGKVSIGHEHLASEIMTSATRELLRLTGPSRPHGEVILACFAEEEHVMPLYAAAFRFVEWNYRPHVLGARTPPSGIAAAVREIEPALVGLSLTIAPEARRTEELVAAYADIMSDRPWIVGGAAAAEVRALVEARGGTVVTGSSEEQRDRVGRLLAQGLRAPRS